jgi:hypothetical protein
MQTFVTDGRDENNIQIKGPDTMVGLHNVWTNPSQTQQMWIQVFGVIIFRILICEHFENQNFRIVKLGPHIPLGLQLYVRLRLYHNDASF